ncbi:MAG: gamma-glutamyltransferase, partial [Oscillospiraceae bacterium]|nr:gamma-glutamyltransferase [Oscillospiraceae bacterium]
MMKNGMFDYKYPSRRLALCSRRGAVGASQHLAAQAGLDTLKKGGNAIDAAVTAAACLVVLEPPSNGMGGDSFAIVSTKNGLFGLNASGPSAMGADADYLKKKGFENMPDRGIYAVTVPGTPAAWAALTRRFGRRTLAQNLEAAIDYAENGFAVSAVQHFMMSGGYSRFHGMAADGKEEFFTWEQAMCPGGVPEPGELHRLPLHAESLRLIARSDAEEFYRGETAEKLDAFSRKYGG